MKTMMKIRISVKIKVVLNEKKYYPLRDERNRDENKGEN